MSLPPLPTLYSATGKSSSSITNSSFPGFDIENFVPPQPQQQKEQQQQQRQTENQQQEQEQELFQLRKKLSSLQETNQELEEIVSTSTINEKKIQQLEMMLSEKRSQLMRTKAKTISTFGEEAMIDDDHDGEQKEGKENQNDVDDDDDFLSQQQEPLPTQKEVTAIIYCELPQLWLQQHEKLSSSLFNEFQHLPLTLVDEEFSQEKHLLKQSISELQSKEFDSFFQSEIETRNSVVAEIESQERFSISQGIRSEAMQLLEKNQKNFNEMNQTGSELQRNLNSKREELQNARGILSSAKEMKMSMSSSEEKQNENSKNNTSNICNNLQKSENGKEENEVEDTTIQKLSQYQDEFSRLQEELFLRPTHEESGLARLQEQVISLTHELNKNRMLLDDINNNLASTSSSGAVGKVQALRTEESTVRRLESSKQELTSQIEVTRERIQVSGIYLDSLNIETERGNFAKQQEQLNREIEDLRDKLDLFEDD